MSESFFDRHRAIDTDTRVTEPPDTWSSRRNNLMWETDDPHPTSMSPGPATPADLE